MGLVTWDLHLNGCQSLKDKRRIIKSLKDRLHNTFNVSVAETGHHELWQRAELTCAVVASDQRHVEQVLAAAGRFVAEHGLARVIDAETSFL
ncbi:MAG TPA: DUF503 domain-containing protein [Gemmatimonadales bacterium]|nr:DUF503 domain-containing protein [Gemmatimonadales bacterium]